MKNGVFVRLLILALYFNSFFITFQVLEFFPYSQKRINRVNKFNMTQIFEKNYNYFPAP